MNQGILLAGMLVLVAVAVPSMAQAKAQMAACDSGDVCCDISGLNCYCSSTQTSGQPVNRECSDSATGWACESSLGATPQTQVGRNCLAPPVQMILELLDGSNS